jgi:hypothetical protein
MSSEATQTRRPLHAVKRTRDKAAEPTSAVLLVQRVSAPLKQPRPAPAQHSASTRPGRRPHCALRRLQTHRIAASASLHLLASAARRNTWTEVSRPALAPRSPVKPLRLRVGQRPWLSSPGARRAGQAKETKHRPAGRQSSGPLHSAQKPASSQFHRCVARRRPGCATSPRRLAPPDPVERLLGHQSCCSLTLLLCSSPGSAVRRAPAGCAPH